MLQRVGAAVMQAIGETTAATADLCHLFWSVVTERRRDGQQAWARDLNG